MKGSANKLTPVVLLCAALIICACATNPQKAKAKYLAAGQNYMKKGDYGDAIVEFRNALRIDPRFVEAYYQVAQADLAQRDWSTAYAALEKAIELDPNRIDARLDRGRLYLAARQFDKAEDEANFILKHEPNHVSAYQLLGAALVGEQKPDPALASFVKITELLPNDPNTYVNLALVEISLRRFNDAEQHLEKAVAVDPQSMQATIDLANFYHLQNKTSEAEKTLQTGIRNNPDAPPLYIDWANLLFNRGKTQEADAVIDSLRAQAPKSAEAAMAIGDYYVKHRQQDKALAEYQRGLFLSSSNVAIERRMEELYLASNRSGQAAQLDTQLMKQAPKDVLVQVNHGRLLAAQNRLSDAIISLQKTVKSFPDSAQAHYHLALAYWQNGSIGQANGQLQEALRVSPGLPQVLQSLTEMNLSQNHASDAQIYAQELVQKFPANVDYRLLLGVVYMRQGQARPAEEQLLAAKQLAPNSAVVHADLGQFYAAKRKGAGAEREFQIALQLDASSAAVLSQYVDYLVAEQRAPKAIVRAQQFVASNPNNIPGHLILGMAHLASRNETAAKAEFERAIQIDPRNVEAYLGTGKIYQEKNQIDAAIGEYQKALDVRPEFPPLCTMIGNLYLERGDLEAARKYYRKALDIDPNFSIALANTAWVDAAESKDLDVGLSMAQKAKSQMPEVPSISDTLAWVLYKKGDYAGAIPLLEDCVKKSPDAAQFHYHLGMALVAVGQKDRGKAQLQSALDMNQLRIAERDQARQVLLSN